MATGEHRLHFKPTSSTFIDFIRLLWWLTTVIRSGERWNSNKKHQLQQYHEFHKYTHTRVHMIQLKGTLTSRLGTSEEAKQVCIPYANIDPQKSLYANSPVPKVSIWRIRVYGPEYTTAGEGNGVGHRISVSAPGQVCKSNLYYELSCLNVHFYKTNQVDTIKLKDHNRLHKHVFPSWQACPHYQSRNRLPRNRLPNNRLPNKFFFLNLFIILLITLFCIENIKVDLSKHFTTKKHNIRQNKKN